MLLECAFISQTTGTYDGIRNHLRPAFWLRGTSLWPRRRPRTVKISPSGANLGHPNNRRRVYYWPDGMTAQSQPMRPPRHFDHTSGPRYSPSRRIEDEASAGILRGRWRWWWGEEGVRVCVCWRGGGGREGGQTVSWTRYFMLQEQNGTEAAHRQCLNTK